MNNGKVFIIAEAGVNHNGSIELAKQLIDAAVGAGADAVKFQTFKTDNLVNYDAPKAKYQMKTTDTGENQYEMLKRLELSDKDFHELYRYCSLKGIQFMSTPFDMDSVDLLLNLGLNLIKISSGDITNGPLLYKVARQGCSVILSTGMSTLKEIEQALGVLALGYTGNNSTPFSSTNFLNGYLSEIELKVLREKVKILHCTTEYPAPFEEINLKAMDALRAHFGLEVGFSDHSKGISIPIAAVARGAQIIEKHFTLDKGLPGPDHQSSLEPVELKTMVTAIRQVEIALGNGNKGPTYSEIMNIPIARKSVVASRDIQMNELFTEKNITVKRPGMGISPMFYWDILYRKASKHYQAGELIAEPVKELPNK